MCFCVNCGAVSHFTCALSFNKHASTAFSGRLLNLYNLVHSKVRAVCNNVECKRKDHTEEL